jgi:hypothetical protein
MNGAKKKLLKNRKRQKALRTLAYQQHEVSLSTLRSLIYDQQAGNPLPEKVNGHDIQGCKYCQLQLEIIRDTDPQLQEGLKDRVLVRSRKSQEKKTTKAA